MKNLLGFVEQRKKMEAEVGDSPGGRHPNRTNGNPTPITSPSFYCMVHDCLFIYIAAGHHIWWAFPYPPPGDADGSLQQGPN